MKRNIILLLFLLFFVIGCGGDESEGDSEVKAVPVEATEAVAEDVAEDEVVVAATQPEVVASRIVLADGAMVAVMPELTLSFETNGRLLTLAVQSGDYVAAGDVIATLEDTALQEAVTSAALQVAQSENSLAQSQLSLDNLLTWTADETAVVVAEANLAAAQESLAQTEAQDAVEGSNLTSANVQILQAQRRVEDAQEAYDKAHDPGRDWELNDPWRADALKAERDGTARGLVETQEALTVAYAQYNLSAAGLESDAALRNAEVTIATAQQSLEQATTGPKESEIAAARLQVEQAELALEQSRFSQTQAENALAKAQLIAPSNGTILSVEVAQGATIGAGSPIVTMLDTDQLEFHTNNLSERDLAQIEVGQTARVILKAHADNPLTGSVARIAPQSSGVVGDAAVFTVMVTVEEAALDLRPGMTGRVEISN